MAPGGSDGIMPTMPTRRQLLAVAGAAVLAGVAETVRGGYLPFDGAEHAARIVGACGGPAPRGAPPGPLETWQFWSRARQTAVGATLAYPPGSGPGDRLPVCVLLHGRGSGHRSPFEGLALHRHLAAHVAWQPPERFALASVDGGNRYWHPRQDGDDPLRMVLDELLPSLEQRGLTVDRFAVLGWSMGGYGALLMGMTAPDRVAAVAASSPAVWPSYEGSRRGGFDSRADWARHDVLRHAGRLDGVPVRVDCGSGDPFLPGVRLLARRLPTDARVVIATGCHDTTYWSRQAPAQLAFVGAALAGA